MMRARVYDPRILLAVALLGAALYAVTAPTMRPVLALLRAGILDVPPATGLLSASGSDAGRYADDPRYSAARAVLEGSTTPAAMQAWDEAVARAPQEATWHLLRAVCSTPEPALLGLPEDPALVSRVREEIRTAVRLSPGNAAPLFAEAVLAAQSGREAEAAALLLRASRAQKWESGLDLLAGVAPAMVAEVHPGHLTAIMSAIHTVPMVSIRPAAAMVARYLGLGEGAPRFYPETAAARVLAASRLALLLRGTAERTWSEDALADQIAGYVRAAVQDLPADMLGEAGGIVERAIRLNQTRAGLWHVVREQRSRTARSGLIGLAGAFLWFLACLVAGVLLLLGVAGLLLDYMPGGGLGYAETGSPAIRMTRIIWIGGVVLGGLVSTALAVLVRDTPSGPTPAAFEWLVQRGLVVVALALLMVLLLSYALHRRGMLAQPISTTLQTILVAHLIVLLTLTVLTLVTAGVLGKGMMEWYSPPVHMDLQTELLQYPFPM